MELFVLYIGTVIASALLYFLVYLVYGEEFSKHITIPWLLVGILFPVGNVIIAGFFCGSTIMGKVSDKLDGNSEARESVDGENKK